MNVDRYRTIAPISGLANLGEPAIAEPDPPEIPLLTATDIRKLDRDLPLLVLTDNLTSYVSWRIKRHTRGNYNHVMWLMDQGQVASQDLFFHKTSIEPYLNGKYRVKLWWSPEWKLWDRVRLRVALNQALQRPPRLRRYDVLGILGQYIRVPALNRPRLNYCSEIAAEVLREVEPGYQAKHPSPADINRWCKGQPHMQVYGLYDPDLCA